MDSDSLNPYLASVFQVKDGFDDQKLEIITFFISNSSLLIPRLPYRKLFFRVPVPVPTFEKLWFRFQLLKGYGSGSGSYF